ncbi:hypothetical protein PRUPE_2G003600, partial [Prunus persica]
SMVKHFSHRHELCSYQVQEDDEIICSSCELPLDLMMNSGTSAYKCTKSKCNFYLHDLCFELPQEIKHKSHPKHPLTLSTPPYEYGEFTCDACGEFGTCFTFHCTHCKYDLHVQCATLPETLSHHHHHHLLTLLYSLPDHHENEGKLNICDFCQGTFPRGCWLYSCRDCDYSIHLGCSTAESDQDYPEDQIIISS